MPALLSPNFSQRRLESLKRAASFSAAPGRGSDAVGIGPRHDLGQGSMGRYWRGTPRKLGPFCILLLSFPRNHRWNGIRPAVLLLSIVGNTVVGLGWFWANLVDTGLHNYGAKSLLMLAVVVLRRSSSSWWV